MRNALFPLVVVALLAATSTAINVGDRENVQASLRSGIHQANPWEPYRAQIVTGGVKGAGIVKSDGTLLSSTADVVPKAGEVKALGDGLGNEANFKSKGINIAGVKYLYLYTKDGTAVGKKGLVSVLLTKTTKDLILYAITNNDVNAALVTSLSAVRSDLISKGF